MKRTLASKWFFITLILTACLAAIVYTSLTPREEYRNKISALTGELSKHQSDKDELRRLLNESRFQGLTLRDDSSNEWVVETPIQFGAQNWVL